MKNKKHNIIVIILLILFGVGCFVVIDYMRDQKKEINTQLIDTFNIDTFWSKFGTSIFGFNENEIKDFSQISDSEKFYLAAAHVNPDKIQKEDQNALYYCGGYTLDYVNNRLKILFGSTIKFDPEGTFQELPSMSVASNDPKLDFTKLNYIKNDKAFDLAVCNFIDSGKTYYKVSNIEIKKDQIIVEAKALFLEYEDNVGILYKDATLKNKLTEYSLYLFNEKNIPLEEKGNEIEAYFDKSFTYQFTLSNDGNYYLKSYKRI